MDLAGSHSERVGTLWISPDLITGLQRPETKPYRIPKRMSDRMSEDMSDKISEDMPDKLSKNIINRISENMPDGMPDKYIR